MKIVVVTALAIQCIVVWVAHNRIDDAYRKGYKDGQQRMVDRIKYELHRDARARLIEETEDLNSIPQA